MNTQLATAYTTENHSKPGLGMKEAAKKTGFTSDRKLYEFLRQHAGFTGTTPPRHLIRSGYFHVRQSHYMRGPVRTPTAVTKCTTAGLSYITSLKNQHETQEATA